LLRHGSLEIGGVVDIARQIADALAYAHGIGVLHRDIKPSNIMVSTSDDGRHDVKVLDFGLARTEADSRLTGSGDFVGTVSYMSPEHVTGETTTEASDVYALGVVMYECFTGAPPFRGQVNTVMRRIVEEAPASLLVADPEIPVELDALVMGCLAKDASARPTSAQVMTDLGSMLATLRASPEFVRRTVTGGATGQGQPGLETPLVGREREVHALQSALDEALDGTAQVMFVGGDYGVGKTRLLRTIERLAASRDVKVLRGHLRDEELDAPYQVFCELFQEHLFRTESTSSTKLVGLLPDLVALFPVLGEAPELRDTTTTRDISAPRTFEKREIFDLLARAIVRISDERPLALFLEDLHRGDRSLEALQYVIRRLKPTSTLIVGTYNPTGLKRSHPLSAMLRDFQGTPGWRDLVLGNLTAPATAMLVRRLLAGDAVDSDVSEKVFAATEGNPLFTHELVQSLVESQILERSRSGSWAIQRGRVITWEDVPATLSQAVERRIDALSDDTRDVLAMASVLGREFDFRELEELAGDEMDVDDGVDRLVTAGLLQETSGTRENRLAFSARIVRDVVYGTLTRRRRRVLHRRKVDALELRNAKMPQRVAHELLGHCVAADLPEKVVKYGLIAAQHAIDTFSPDSAISAARMVLDFLDEGDAEADSRAVGESHLVLAQARGMAGELDSALRSARRALAAFESSGEMSRGATATAIAARCAWNAHRTDDASLLVSSALEMSGDLFDRDTRRDLLRLGATLSNLRGDFSEGDRLASAAAELGLAPKSDQQSGPLRVGLAGRVDAREPASFTSIEEREILSCVFETLVATDAHGHLRPLLCESWKSADGGRSLIVRLRSTVRFHDGAPLTAAAVCASFERAAEGCSGVAAAPFADLESVHAVDEHTVRFSLRAPVPIFPALLTHFSTAVTRVTSQGVVGTGAFVWHEADDHGVEIRRHDDYWGGGETRVPGVVFRTGLSSAAIESGLSIGDLHVGRDLLPSDLDRLRGKSHLAYQVIETPKKDTSFIVFSRSGVLGKNPALRHALAAALDVEDLVYRTVGALAVPAMGLIPPGILGHDPGRRRPNITRDEIEAVMAGVELPRKLVASVHPLFHGRYAALLDGIRTVWASLQVELEVRTHDYAAYMASRSDSTGFDLLVGRWNADYDDPDGFAHVLVHSRSGMLRDFYSSDVTDALVEEGRRTTEVPRRVATYRRFEQVLASEAFCIPLFHEVDYRIAQSWVKDLRLESVAPFIDYRGIGLGERRETAAVSRGRGILNVPCEYALGELTPGDPDASEILSNVYETLFRALDGARPAPWLAADAVPSNGFTCWRLRLRKGVRFHDGRRLGARDVQWSFERFLRCDDAGAAGDFKHLKGAAALMQRRAVELTGFRLLSLYEFELSFDKPIAVVPQLLSSWPPAIIPEGAEPGGERVVSGTGPFRVAHLARGERLDLEAFPGYWRYGHPCVDGLTFYFDLGSQEIVDGFKSGQYQILTNPRVGELERLRRDPELARGFRHTPGFMTTFVMFNCRQGPLTNYRLRRSVASLLKLTDMKDVLPPFAAEAASLTPPELLGAFTETERRRSETTSRGVGLGLELSLAVLGEVDDQQQRVFDRVVELLSRNGVSVSFDETDQISGARGIEVTADLVLARWSARHPDAGAFLADLVNPESGVARRHYGSDRVNGLLDEARREPDVDRRSELYRQIDRLLVVDMGFLPLFHEQTCAFFGPDVEVGELGPFTPVLPYADLRVR